MRKTAALFFDPAAGVAGTWRVELPSYEMIAGTFAPIKAGLIHADGIEPGADPADVLALGPTVDVELPDYTPTDKKTGQLDLAALREMYPSDADVNAKDFASPIVTKAGK